MARRTGNTAVVEADENTSTEATEAESIEVPADETPVEESTDEVVASEDAATEERDSSGDTVTINGETMPADAEPIDPEKFDLGPFQTLAAEVVAQADDDTGALPDGGLERVLEAYRALPDTKVRNRAKRHLQEEMAKGLEALQMRVAKGYLTLADNMTTAATKAGGGTTRQPADPKARWQQQLEIVTLAYGELYNQRPEGVDEEAVNAIVAGLGSLSEQMGTFRTFLDTEVPEGEEKPEEPKVDDKVKAAFRLVRGGKGTSGRPTVAGVPHTGPRRDIGKHILNAFADVEPGTFLTVAQIRAKKSDEYGDEAPSAGAISARLFPASGKCTIEGIEPGTGGEKAQRGATKL